MLSFFLFASNTRGSWALWHSDFFCSHSLLCCGSWLFIKIGRKKWNKKKVNPCQCQNVKTHLLWKWNDALNIKSNVLLTVLFPLFLTIHLSTTDSFSSTVIFEFWLLSKNGCLCCTLKLSVMKNWMWESEIWERKHIKMAQQRNIKRRHLKEGTKKKFYQWKNIGVMNQNLFE